MDWRRTTAILLTTAMYSIAAQAVPFSAQAAAVMDGERTAEIRDIARDGYIYGYPIVDAYNVLYSYCLDPASSEYKGRLNEVHHTRTVATPQDKAVIAPNVDTPYSHAWLDLRAEPVVLTIPAFEKDRYVSLQLFDLYSYITGYVTPRTNGNMGGDFLVVGPGWKGEVPKGITGVFHSTTSLALGLYRVQLLDAGDLKRVHAIQDGFKVTPLSTWQGRPSPLPAAALDPVKPVNLRTSPLDPQFFTVLNWMLRFMPVLPDDGELRNRLSALGVRPAAAFNPAPASIPAVIDGMGDGLKKMGERAKRVRSSAELFGSREYLGTDYLVRATGAMLGIYGNSAEEFLGIGYQSDSTGQPFDGANRYTIHFDRQGFPPVGAFWSITVYNNDKLLYDNTIKRYVINSPLIPSLIRDVDGGVTLYVQHNAPEGEAKSNWLPVPSGSFGLTFRTYLPGDAIRDGKWRAPPVVKQP